MPESTRRWSWGRSLFRGSKKKLKTTTASDQPQRLFPQWAELPQDLQVRVLSFLATAPYEDPKQDSHEATLTASWPLVCHQWNQTLSRSPALWSLCLERCVAQQPVWQRARQECHVRAKGIRSAAEAEEAPLVMGSRHPQSCYQELLCRYIRSELPVFVMPFRDRNRVIPVGYSYVLFLFEPRYQFMVRGLLATKERTGDKMYFVHAHGDCREQATALLVEVRNCLHETPRTGYNGYTVSLRVAGQVQLERLWVRPKTGSLRMAQVRRLSC